MGSDDPADQAPDIDERLNRETGAISWAELVRHFARGVVINVTGELDLIDAAACLAQDDTRTLQTWLDEGVLRRASDDDARDWTAREPEFWCVVTAPWVLVQEKQPQVKQPQENQPQESKRDESGATPRTMH